MGLIIGPLLSNDPSDRRPHTHRRKGETRVRIPKGLPGLGLGVREDQQGN